MAEPTLSLVIPTIGRPTLARTLASVRQQLWRAGDEVLLVGDGPQPIARDLWNQFKLPGRYLETEIVLGHWGHGVRNWVFDNNHAIGQFVMALDDDDELTPQAVDTVRRAIAAAPDQPHLFRMSGVPGLGTLWKVKELAEQNVGTPMFVTPNDSGRLGRYTLRYGGDFDFIQATCAMYGNDLTWHPEVICRVRPNRSSHAPGRA